LLEVHGGSVEVGISRQPIPVHFALQKELSEHSRDMGADCVYAMRHFFDMPDLANIDDVISDGAYHAQANECEKHVPGQRRCNLFMEALSWLHCSSCNC
jgi:AMP nucleosidase